MLRKYFLLFFWSSFGYLITWGGTEKFSPWPVSISPDVTKHLNLFRYVFLSQSSNFPPSPYKWYSWVNFKILNSHDKYSQVAINFFLIMGSNSRISSWLNFVFFWMWFNFFQLLSFYIITVCQYIDTCRVYILQNIMPDYFLMWLTLYRVVVLLTNMFTKTEKYIHPPGQVTINICVMEFELIMLVKKDYFF